MRRAESLAFENMPFLDSGALEDPLVAGVDHPRKLGISEYVGRHVAMHPGDRGMDRGFFLFGSLRHAPVNRGGGWNTRGSG